MQSLETALVKENAMRKYMLLCVALALFASAQTARADDPTMNRLVTSIERLESRIAALESRMGSGMSCSSFNPTPAIRPSYVQPVNARQIPTSYRQAPVSFASQDTSFGDSAGAPVFHGQFNYQGYRVVYIVYQD